MPQKQTSWKGQGGRHETVGHSVDRRGPATTARQRVGGLVDRCGARSRRLRGLQSDPWWHRHLRRPRPRPAGVCRARNGLRDATASGLRPAGAGRHRAAARVRDAAARVRDAAARVRDAAARVRDAAAYLRRAAPGVCRAATGLRGAAAGGRLSQRGSGARARTAPGPSLSAQRAAWIGQARARPVHSSRSRASAEDESGPFATHFAAYSS
jgi:hypothetical protein